MINFGKKLKILPWLRHEYEDWYREGETDALRGIYGAIWGNTIHDVSVERLQVLIKSSCCVR